MEDNDNNKDVTPEFPPVANGPWTIPVFKAVGNLPVPRRVERGNSLSVCIIPDDPDALVSGVQHHALSELCAIERGPDSES